MGTFGGGGKAVAFCRFGDSAVPNFAFHVSALSAIAFAFGGGRDGGAAFTLPRFSILLLPRFHVSVLLNPRDGLFPAPGFEGFLASRPGPAPQQAWPQGRAPHTTRTPWYTSKHPFQMVRFIHHTYTVVYLKAPIPDGTLYSPHVHRGIPHDSTLGTLGYKQVFTFLFRSLIDFKFGNHLCHQKSERYVGKASTPVGICAGCCCVCCHDMVDSRIDWQ